MSSFRLAWLVVVVCAVASACTSTPPNRHLVILVDGLRPDYVTDAVMPNLTALGKRGVVFTRHHSVYPTVTRVNASSISTGAYPEAHGLMGNSVYFPRVDPAKFLDTANRDHLLAIAKAEGRLLTAPTLGESLHSVGRKMLVASSGSSGSAFLNNHTLSGGGIVHYQYALPAELAEAVKAIGPPPGDDAPAAARDRYAVDAFLKVGLSRVDPSVTVLWLSGLDSTAHDHGIGAPATIEILRHVDGEIKRIEDGLEGAGLRARYNIWVTSDHGFSTHTGAIDLGAVLQPFAGALPDGSPRLVSSGGAIYVRDGNDVATAAIVAGLQKTPGVGAIFTREAQPGSFDGRVPGTLSFSAVRWGHDRSAQILFSPDWSDAANGHGMPGSAASSGVAGHGSSSPWDVHNTLIAAGPDLKQNTTIEVPSANVDFAPTFLSLLGIAIPPTMQGRPLMEALASAAPSTAPAIRTVQHTASTPDVSYSVTGRFSIVTADGREYRYFDGTSVTRK